MEYKGPVYAKIGGKYIKCTESVADLENRIKELENQIKKSGWQAYADAKPEVGRLVDVYSPKEGRFCDYEYEGNGVFYNNNEDNTKEVEFNHVTHWRYVEYPDS